LRPVLANLACINRSRPLIFRSSLCDSLLFDFLGIPS
jgi:hypothetical protein